MKKLLSVFATVGVVASSTVSVVACGTKKEDKNSKPEEPKNVSQVVQHFEQDVTKIWVEHYEKEVAGDLITIEGEGNGYKFLNKENILKFSKPENKDKLTSQEKKEFTNDVEKLFKTELLKQKLNDLKKVNEYKIILDEVDSVFEHVELLFNDNFKINSGEIVSGAYIGNVIVDYKVVTQYKGVNDVEKFKQSGTLKYTSTESESFKKVGDAMYKNIAKDMFISQETQKYLNLKWSDIKGEKQNYEAYVNSNAELKKYYNDNEEFHEALLKLVKNKYFKDSFSALDISYDKKSIYKTDNFLEQNKDYLIMNNFDKENAIVVKQGRDREKISKILLGDEGQIKEVLKSEVFNSIALQKNRVKYGVAQDKFLNAFLSEDEVREYKLTDSYGFAVAMGYANFVGPSIKVGVGQNSYVHRLPDFKLVISYSMNGENDEIGGSLVDLSLKLFGVYKELWAPNKVNNNSYLLGINYDQNNIWEKINDESGYIRKVDIDNYMIRFSDFYRFNLEKKLNKLNIVKDIFNNSILFDFKLKVTDRYYKLAKTVVHNKVTGFEKWLINVERNDNVFKNIDYLQFGLFGIVKMNIYFDENIEKGFIF